MGKVVRTLAMVGLAVAIAVVAPQLGLTFAFALSSSVAVGTAVATAALSLAAGALMSAIGSNPSSTKTEERRPIMIMENFRWRQIDRCAPDAVPFGPVPLRLWKSPVLALTIWWISWVYGTRFWLSRNMGVCMEPSLPKGWWVLIDSRRAAQPGDAISFMTDDLFENWVDDLSLLRQIVTTGMIKEYMGMSDDGKVMVFRSRNDPVTGHTGIDRLQYLHVVVSTHRYWLSALWALLRAYCGRG